MPQPVNMSEIMGRTAPGVKHLDGCNFRFYEHYKEIPSKTEKGGRPIHEDCDFIEIINFAGEKTPRPVEDRDKLAYPAEWAHYLDKKTPPATGTWLVEWPILSVAKLRDLQYLGYKTVEQVAAISEEQIKKMPGLKQLQRMAKNWLQAADSSQNKVTALEEQLHKANQKFSKLEEQYLLALKRIEQEQGVNFAQ